MLKLVGVVTQSSRQLRATWHPWWQRHQASLPAHNEGGVTKFVRPSTAIREKGGPTRLWRRPAEQEEGKHFLLMVLT